MIRFQPVSGSTYTEWQKTMCSSDEFSSYKLAAGKVLGEILLEVMNPIYEMHPDITPDELK